MRFEGVSAGSVFGASHEIMRFTPGVICPPGDTTWFVGLEWLLVKGIGVYAEQTLEIQERRLIGAIINGVKYGSFVSVPELPSAQPTNFVLMQNYPNPFNPSTTIKFELPNSSVVKLSVYDMLGREVSVLEKERRDAGVHEVTFDGSGLSSGVYFYRLQVRPLDSAIGRDSKSGAGDFVQSKKLLLLK